MPGRLTKLLITWVILAFGLPKFLSGQCALITDNYSGQSPSSVCAPVNLTMNVRYKFILPVNPSRVEILYVWNDGTGATAQVPGVSEGDTIFTASQSHLYLPSDQCSYTAEAYIVYDGEVCSSSSRQEQTFSAWARDNENGAEIITEPQVARFCEGEDIVDVTFDDNSTFNCNINIEPDKPNRLTRWVQFIYGTYTIGGDRIPNVSVTDPWGNTYQLTDAAGNSLGTVSGPVIEIPLPADGPNQTSWSINAPAGGIAGDIFEITMRNWNMCNPYDQNPFDSIPPTDITDGDYDPITTPALIEIITTPPRITNPSLEFCVDNPIHLTLSTSGGTVDWYTDSLTTNHIHTGNSFDPTGPPTFVDNSASGQYSYYVVESIGACGSAPSKISFEIFDSPSPPSDAGDDRIVCADTVTLDGNVPNIGIGSWSTTGGAIIDDPSDPKSFVRNLDPGPNLFRWTLNHGPCQSIDEVIITRDRQPDSATAGTDHSFCDISTVTMTANNPTYNGTGTWSVVAGYADFSDIHDSHTNITNISGGENIFVWTIESQYGACTTTSDTMQIIRDVTPDPANAGTDRRICESDTFRLEGNPETDDGNGLWSILSGGSAIALPTENNALATGLGYGINRFLWTISSQFGICSYSSDEVVITRDESPAPSDAGMDQFLCNSFSSPLGANVPSIGTGVWSVVTNPSGVNPVFSPSAGNENATVQILPGNEGLYRFAWTITNFSCVTSDTVTLDFGIPVPTADAGQDDTVCGTDYVFNGNNPGTGTGTWTKVSGSGNVTFIPNNHSPGVIARISPGDEGLYAFEWRITSGSCPPSADTVWILFKPRPGIPVAGNEESCGPASVTLISTIGANGTSNNWYDTSTGGTLLGTDTSFTTPILESSRSYYVATFDNATQCESPRRRADVIIHPVPGQPVATDMEHCGITALTFNASIGTNGSTNRWYDAPTGGNMLSETQHYTSGILSNDTTFWVSSYNGSTGCESPRLEVNGYIYPLPDQPGVTDRGRCGEGNITLTSVLGANSTMNRWYEVASGGTVFDSVPSITTPYLSASKNYWVSGYNDTTRCESNRKLVQALIYSIPALPVADDVSNCGPDTLLLGSVPGNQATISRWYDSITGGNLLYQGDNFTAGYLTNTGRYYVSSYNDTTTCESARTEVMAIILPTPEANPILGVGQVGQGQTNVIYSVNYNPGSTYTWTIPPGINLLLENQNFVILEFPNIGLYNISVYETNSIGCPGPETHKPIQVREDLMYINLNVIEGHVCTGNDLQLSAVPSGGTPSYSFKWTGDAHLLSADSVSNPVFRSGSPGTYHLYATVTDINLNKVTDTLDVIVYPNPYTGIIADDTVVCAGSTLPLRTTIAGGSGVYSSFLWSGQTTPLSSTTSLSPLFTSLIRGFYDLKFTVKDNNGCKASDSITVFNDLPRSDFISDATPRCSPVTVNFVNRSENAATYLWKFGDGDSAVTTNPTHLFTNHGNSLEYYNTTLTAYSVNGCTHISNMYVTVYPNPKAVIDVIPGEACDPADVLMSATPGGYSYSWEFGDGASETGGYNIIHKFANDTEHDTTYFIRLISTSFFNCFDTASAQIRIHPSPVASFTVSPISQMYPDRTVNITNTTEDKNWDYKWYFGDKTISLEKNPLTHRFPEADDYTISLVVRGEHCSDSIWSNIEILPHPPVARFQPIQPGCVPLTIQFENSSSYSTSFLWEFGDGAISNKPNPEYTYYEAGVFKIKLTAYGEGGTDTYSTVNDIYVLPKAFFDLAPRYVYVNDKEVNFFNLSDNGSIYEWDFGDGSTSDEFNPKHLYTQEGTYDITLSVWTENNCFDLYVMENAVVVQPSGKLVFPNAFRPESPIDENRKFRPGVIDQVDEYHLMIFNRWGEMVFESFDKDTGWDGRIDGRLAKQDVYVWKVEGKYTNGQSFTDVGDVTLLH